MKCGKLTLITGPMWSGKTTELLRQYDRKMHAKVKCLLVKHGIDTRYQSQNHVVTHVNTYGLHTKGQAVVYDTISALIHGEGLFADNKTDTVFIDEIQFFPDKHLCLELLNVGIDVVLAGLNGDFNQCMFPGMDALFAAASDIRMFTAICGLCHREDAPYSSKLQKGGNQQSIDIGGADKYIPTCLKCKNQITRTNL